MQLSSVSQARFNMIEQQVRPWNVLNPQVLDLLNTISRDQFVPEAYKALAFADTTIPLDQGKTMLPPRVQARMLQDLGLDHADKVLHIGAGSGFVSALLSQQARHVYALEIVPSLAEMARRNLQNAGIRNVDIQNADGAAGLPAQAPFDAILLSGAVQEVPQSLLDQLKTGGRLMAIVGQDPIMHAVVITRVDSQHFKTELRWETDAPYLHHFPAPSAFTF
jgi:protein-L-isoaspartate(D-aspartate) O-methyltransferase